MSEGKYDCFQKYRYRAAAFSGVRTYSGMATGGTRICSVFACTGDTIETCGQRFSQYEENSTAIFEQLLIIATVPAPRTDASLSASNSSYFPISLDTSIMPLKPEDFEFNTMTFFDTVTVYTFNLINSIPELYSFAVWGREFTTDGEEASPPVEHDVDPIEETTTTSSPEDDSSSPGSSVIHRISVVSLVTCIVVLLVY